MIFDGDSKDSNPPDNIINIVYNRLEQGFLAGYLAGLMTEKHNNNSIELISGPMDTKTETYLFQGIEIGIHTVNPSMDFKVSKMSGWNDKSKSVRMTADYSNKDVGTIIAYAAKADSRSS